MSNLFWCHQGSNPGRFLPLLGSLPPRHQALRGTCIKKIAIYHDMAYGIRDAFRSLLIHIIWFLLGILFFGMKLNALVFY
jgi:hypothetical protein